MYCVHGRRLLFIAVFALAKPPADLRSCSHASASAACFDVRCQPSACSSLPSRLSGIRASLPCLVKWMWLRSGDLAQSAAVRALMRLIISTVQGAGGSPTHGARLLLSMNLSSGRPFCQNTEFAVILHTEESSRGQNRSRVDTVGNWGDCVKVCRTSAVQGLGLGPHKFIKFNVEICAFLVGWW